MQSGSSNNLQKRLIESNVKTQETASEVVKSVKELVSALKEAGEVPEPEPQMPKDINTKLDKIIQQNNQLAAMINEVLRLHNQSKPLSQPPQPPGTWKKL
jgi:hypothetical protein